LFFSEVYECIVADGVLETLIRQEVAKLKADIKREILEVIKGTSKGALEVILQQEVIKLKADIKREPLEVIKGKSKGALEVLIQQEVIKLKADIKSEPLEVIKGKSKGALEVLIQQEIVKLKADIKREPLNVIKAKTYLSYLYYVKVVANTSFGYYAYTLLPGCSQRHFVFFGFPIFDFKRMVIPQIRLSHLIRRLHYY
jgi:hypothetical protein